MQDIILTAIGVVAGALVTTYVSQHYYRRTIQKEIAAFVMTQTNVLANTENDIKKDIDLRYCKEKVENLQLLEVLIGNTGERSISTSIRPLRFEIPNNSKFLNASILKISPETREVKVRPEKNRSYIEFDFPILNSGDYFVFKALIHGSPSREELKFSIMAEDLPANIEIKRQTTEYFEESYFGKEEWHPTNIIIPGLFTLFFGICIGLLAFFVDADTQIINDTSSLFWINKIPLLRIAKAIGYFSSGLIITFMFIFISIEISNSLKPKRKKFNI